MKRFLGVLGVAIVMLAGHANAETSTPPLGLVRTYVSGIGEIDRIRKAFAKESATLGPQEKTLASINAGASLILEMRATNGALRQVRIADADIQGYVENVIKFREQQIAMFDQLNEISQNFLGNTPKPGVDLQAQVAEIPKIRAHITYIDRSLFQASPILMMSLVSKTPDKAGHMSHMIITKDERKQLIRDLDLKFGKDIDKIEDGQSYELMTASVLKQKLLEFKCSDEP